MPIPSPLAVAPYDSWESIVQAARAKLNDMIASTSGDILTDTAPFTLPLLINAWREFQLYLTVLGHSRFKQRVVLYSFPPFASTDPSAVQQLSWAYFFDGTSYYSSAAVNVLPQDLILPLKIYERQSGLGLPFPNEPMGQALDGLPNRPYAQAHNGCWAWEEDAICLPGSQYTMDLLIYYAAYLPDPATVNTVPWYSTAIPLAPNQQCPIMRALTPMAYYLAAEVGSGRNDVDVQTLRDKAEDETKRVFNVEAKQKQRTTCSRKRFSSEIRPGGSYVGRF